MRGKKDQDEGGEKRGGATGFDRFNLEKRMGGKKRKNREAS